MAGAALPAGEIGAGRSAGFGSSSTCTPEGCANWFSSLEGELGMEGSPMLLGRIRLASTLRPLPDVRGSCTQRRSIVTACWRLRHPGRR
jgi:hypothetical protein